MRDPVWNAVKLKTPFIFESRGTIFCDALGDSLN